MLAQRVCGSWCLQSSAEGTQKWTLGSAWEAASDRRKLSRQKTQVCETDLGARAARADTREPPELSKDEVDSRETCDGDGVSTAEVDQAVTCGTADPERAKSLARGHTVDAVRTLGELMRDATTPPGVRVRAAELLLDRGWGRPLQSTVSANLDVRQLSDAELVRIIMESEGTHRLPELIAADRLIDNAVETAASEGF